MGVINALRNVWEGVKNAYYASEELKEAIDNKDLNAADLAISHANPTKRIFEDPVLRIIGEYSKSEDCDREFLNELYQSVYTHFDTIDLYKDPLGVSEPADYSHIPEYKNPLRVYAMAAYMNDTAQLEDLGKKGIEPDKVSNEPGLTENIVMGTARLGMFDAMKEVIKQGASLDRNYGYDDFPPLHAFAAPLFHVFHPGVTEALKETGNTEVLKAIDKAFAAGLQDNNPGPDAPKM